jgi:type IV secretory pathway VirJ component
MNKRLHLLFFFLTLALGVPAQNLTIKEWNASTHNKPFIFYISGDGGFNRFSNELCTSINKEGFDVTGLDSKSYFWSKKTPEQTAEDISDFLSKKIAGRPNQQIVMIGYSFGADVLPFVLNRLPRNIADKVKVSFLMASSGSTDFVIHIADLFGSGKRRGMDVLTEVNKVSNHKIVILNSSDDQGLDAKKITTKNHITEVLPGGHHFDGDIDEIVKTILKYI